MICVHLFGSNYDNDELFEATDQPLNNTEFFGATDQPLNITGKKGRFLYSQVKRSADCPVQIARGCAPCNETL